MTLPSSSSTPNHPATDDTILLCPDRMSPMTRFAASAGFGLLLAAFVAASWVVMWWASVRLTPDPVGDARRATEASRRALLAELEKQGPAGPILDLDLAAHGRDLFMGTCATCHAGDGTGVTGLGRDLVRSTFVRDSSDKALFEMIDQGRPADHPLNATKVPMPPRGGNSGLSDEDISAIVHYLRGLQDPRRMPELPAYVAKPPAPPSEQEKASALAAAGGDPELAEYIASGSKLYASTCVACHGADGIGVTGNGKPLAGSDFVRSMDDEALLAFIQRGRSPTDPQNTTGIAMPPKGGNPALSEDDMLDIIAYLRTLPGNAVAGSRN
jgi:mono/diheme cytochrome c family protein